MFHDRHGSSLNRLSHRARTGHRDSVRGALLAFFVALAACGGDGNEPASPTPTPTNPPAPVNDPLFVRQWHLENTGQEGAVRGADVKARGAWAQGVDGSGVTIAIFDDGFDLQHEELVGRIQILPGSDLSDRDSDPSAKPAFEDSHGTAVSGVALAAGNNSAGGLGIAYRARLMPFRFLSDESTATNAEVAAAYRSAADHGADLLSNSWGTDGERVLPDVLRSAMDYVTTQGRGGRGAAILFAAGNEASNTADRLIQGYSRVITVAASTDHDFPSSYTNFGAEVDIAAPSNGGTTTGIWTTDVTGIAGYNSGIPSGTFLVGVSTLSGSGGYTLLLGPAGPAVDEAEANNTVQSAQGVAYPSTINATTDSPSTRSDVLIDYGFATSFYSDLFRFTASSQNVTVGLRSDLANADLDLVVTDAQGRILRSSNGPTPQENISLFPSGDDAGGYTNSFGGTSSSTPLAAGVAALILQANPALSAQQVQQILQDTADKVGGTYDANGHFDQMGFGRINAERAVQRARQTTAAAAVPAPAAGLWPRASKPGSGLYWYSAGQAHRLELDRGSTFVRRREEAPALRRRARSLTRIGLEERLMLLGARREALPVPARDLADYQRNLQGLRAAYASLDVAPALTTSDGAPMWLGDRLIAALPPGTSSRDVAGLFAQMGLQLSGAVGPGELILRSREGGLATLNAANALYESGRFLYAHPDFELNAIPR